MDDFTEIEALRRELIQAGHEYYVLDKPTMSDFDYDHKLRRLEELTRTSAPRQLLALRDKEIRFTEIVPKEQTAAAVRRMLGIG